MWKRTATPACSPRRAGRRHARAAGDAHPHRSRHRQSNDEQATIVAGSVPGVVLRTPRQSMRCSGLAERLRYDRVPADLSARPVLACATVSPPRTVTVQPLPVSSGFDWRAAGLAETLNDQKQPWSSSPG
ncbi:hypothetical protein AB5I41_12490 [Sphingomonas sp. MMS24-JH45]